MEVLTVTFAALIFMVLYLGYTYIGMKKKYKDVEDKIPGPPTRWTTGNAHDFGNTACGKKYYLNEISVRNCLCNHAKVK